jgi:hypothetical protein
VAVDNRDDPGTADETATSLRYYIGRKERGAAVRIPALRRLSSKPSSRPKARRRKGRNLSFPSERVCASLARSLEKETVAVRGRDERES